MKKNICKEHFATIVEQVIDILFDECCRSSLLQFMYDTIILRCIFAWNICVTTRSYAESFKEIEKIPQYNIDDLSKKIYFEFIKIKWQNFKTSQDIICNATIKRIGDKFKVTSYLLNEPYSSNPVAEAVKIVIKEFKETLSTSSPFEIRKEIAIFITQLLESKHIDELKKELDNEVEQSESKTFCCDCGCNLKYKALGRDLLDQMYDKVSRKELVKKTRELAEFFVEYPYFPIIEFVLEDILNTYDNKNVLINLLLTLNCINMEYCHIESYQTSDFDEPLKSAQKLSFMYELNKASFEEMLEDNVEKDFFYFIVEKTKEVTDNKNRQRHYLKELFSLGIFFLRQKYYESDFGKRHPEYASDIIG